MARASAAVPRFEQCILFGGNPPSSSATCFLVSLSASSMCLPRASSETIDETAIAERSARELNAEFHKVTIAPSDVEECFDDFIQSLDQVSS